MRRSRGISLPAHSVVELLTGLALLGAAFTLDAGTAGTLGLFGAGVVLAGMGLGAADSLAIRAHESLDAWLTTALALGSVAMAFADERGAALALLAAAAAQLALTTATHWTRAPAAR